MDAKLRAYLDDLHEGFPAFDDMEKVEANAVGSAGPPLHYAIVQNELDIVRLLLENGADPAHMDDYGYTSLDLAVEFARTEMVPLLQRHGARLCMMNEDDLRELQERPQQEDDPGFLMSSGDPVASPRT